eukprot:TRINITY_DN1072_c0_g1_i1.p1 TRINITY_DN1072_c0_g1~~TRINITY_DN1072_c0_g1_i1.p1  ORF type:complete len:128 (+),score=7.21 TRINITY_DN1072_c0_g1_i1:913-1296(+)
MFPVGKARSDQGSIGPTFHCWSLTSCNPVGDAELQYNSPEEAGVLAMLQHNCLRRVTSAPLQRLTYMPQLPEESHQHRVDDRAESFLLQHGQPGRDLGGLGASSNLFNSGRWHVRQRSDSPHGARHR